MFNCNRSYLLLYFFFLLSYLQDIVAMDTQTQISNSKEHIKMLYNSISKLKDITERMVLRSTSYASDMLQFGKELR